VQTLISGVRIPLIPEARAEVQAGRGGDRGVDLTFDWETVIKTEYQREFFKMYRETYNFFKHADKDTADLPVHNIAEGNAVALTMAIENYKTMFGTLTEHMKLFSFSRGCGSQNGSLGRSAPRLKRKPHDTANSIFPMSSFSIASRCIIARKPSSTLFWESHTLRLHECRMGNSKRNIAENRTGFGTARLTGGPKIRG